MCADKVWSEKSKKERGEPGSYDTPETIGEEESFPCSGCKESAYNVGHLGLIPELGRSPGGGHGNPLQYSHLENLHGQRSLVGTVHGVTKSQIWLSDYTQHSTSPYSLDRCWLFHTTLTQQHWVRVKIAAVAFEMLTIILSWCLGIFWPLTAVNLYEFICWTMLRHCSHDQPTECTLWPVVCQSPLSKGFSRQEYWSGLPFPSPRDSLDPGTETLSLKSPMLGSRFFTTSASWEAHECIHLLVIL